MKLLHTLSTAILLYTVLYYIPHGLVNALGFRKKLNPFISTEFNQKLMKIGYIQIFLVFFSIFPGVVLQNHSIYLACFSLLSLAICFYLHSLQFQNTEKITIFMSVKKTIANFITLFIDNSFLYKVLFLIIMLGPLMLSIGLSYKDNLFDSLEFLQLFIFFAIFLSMPPTALFFSEYLLHIIQEKSIVQQKSLI